jgi:SAM-dependent methyltransferase
MSQPSIVRLREFYASPLGKVVRRQLFHAVAHHWPQLGDDLICAVGYATPPLRPFLRQEHEGEAQIFPVMPAQQGAMTWPSFDDNRAVLAHTERLPYPEHSFNRVVLLHALEHADSQQHLLEECWRILTPGGRILVMVPNRLSAWARVQRTPFSAGRPYSREQLREVVCRLFTHVETSAHLFVPPSRSAWVHKAANAAERLGHLLPFLPGGVTVMQAEKQIYAGLAERVDKKTPVYLPVAKPALSRTAK